MFHHILLNKHTQLMNPKTIMNVETWTTFLKRNLNCVQFFFFIKFFMSNVHWCFDSFLCNILLSTCWFWLLPWWNFLDLIMLLICICIVYPRLVSGSSMSHVALHVVVSPAMLALISLCWRLFGQLISSKSVESVISPSVRKVTLIGLCVFY